MSELLSGIMGLLLGALIGHRLALGRDKRKEFNQVVAPIYERLIQAEEQALNGHVWAIWSEGNWTCSLRIIARQLVWPTLPRAKSLGRVLSQFRQSSTE